MNRRRAGLRGRAHVVVFNAAWVAVGLAVVALAAEGWARSKADFRRQSRKHYAHPKAGQLLVPGSEVRSTNMLDYWTVSRANRWGFLDRPPPSVRHAADDREPSCRVAVVGDSFVDARQVAVFDKLHVRFEEMARERLPALGIAASAYGYQGTGQINQLGYYDEFVSRTSPHVVVLVFVYNDFFDNFPALQAYRMDRRPDQLPWVTAARGGDGAFELLPPVATRRTTRRSDGTGPADKPAASVRDALRRFEIRAVRSSYALGMLAAKRHAWMGPDRYRSDPTYRDDPRYAEWFVDWEDWPNQTIDFATQDLPAAGREALEYTAFALDQWGARSRRDNFFLAILASHTMGARGLSIFDRLERMASARGIPVVDQTAYIQRRRNDRVQDVQFAHDTHWNAKGHLWAAEALLEWLEQNRDACARIRHTLP